MTVDSSEPRPAVTLDDFRGWRGKSVATAIIA